MTDPGLCKKCKQPCDDTCAPCKKGYILHYRCMKPGDRLLVRLKRNKTTLVGLCGLAGMIAVAGGVVASSLLVIGIGSIVAAIALIYLDAQRMCLDGT